MGPAKADTQVSTGSSRKAGTGVRLSRMRAGSELGARAVVCTAARNPPKPSAVPRKEGRCQGTSAESRGAGQAVPFPPVWARATPPHAACPLGPGLLILTRPCPLRGGAERGGVEWGQNGNAKKCPPRLSTTFASLAHPVPGSGESAGQKTHVLPKKREGQAQEAGACTEHHPREGVFPGDLLPTCPGRRQAGPGPAAPAAPRNAPEYQGTAGRASSSAPQRRPRSVALRAYT